MLDFGKFKTFVDILRKQADVQPEKIALVDEDGSYSYGQLDEVSNGVASKLLGLEIGKGDIVPVVMPRGKDFVAAFIGVMKMGAAFVPMNENWPKAKIESIKKNIKARNIINNVWMADVEPSKNSVNQTEEEDVAFIIFTSGSTGRPKGVVHTHKSAYAMVKAEILSCFPDPSLNYSNIIDLSFIGGIHDVLTCLSLGTTLYIASDSIRKNGAALSEWITSNHIGAMKGNPSFFKVLLENYDINIKYLELGSERMIPISKLPERTINTYGCTEFPLPATIGQVKQNSVLSIGRPAENVTVFIMDDFGEICSPGTIGEICLVGPQMADSYWKMPELTAEKFVKCPFLPGDVRMYRTGDLAKYNEYGDIEIVGRKDFQIKIRGFRIEPGEIENAAIKFPGIENVVAVAKEIGEEKYLVLYYTAVQNLDKDKLKRHLSLFLADFMVPSFFEQLDVLPLNDNGKIDRAALPEPRLSAVGSDGNNDDSYRNDYNLSGIEAIVYNVVSDICRMRGFSPNDRLADLGISSIGRLKIIIALQQKGFETKASAIDGNTTVKTLSQWLYGKAPEPTEPIQSEHESKPIRVWKTAYRKRRPKLFLPRQVIFDLLWLIPGAILLLICRLRKNWLDIREDIIVYQRYKFHRYGHIEDRVYFLLFIQLLSIDYHSFTYILFLRLNVFHRFIIFKPHGIRFESERIGAGFRIQHGWNTIGNPREIGHHCIISHNVGIINSDMGRCRSIGNNVYIGAYSTIYGPVTIGNNAKVAPGSVVNDNVPPYSVVEGNPARVVGFSMTPDEIIKYEKSMYPENERMTYEEALYNYKKFYLNRIKDNSPEGKRKNISLRQ